MLGISTILIDQTPNNPFFKKYLCIVMSKKINSISLRVTVFKNNKTHLNILKKMLKCTLL